MIPAPEISVVAPLRNESPNVEPLATRIFAALEKTGRSFELILVDDCSTDDTWSGVKRLCETDSPVTAIRNLRVFKREILETLPIFNGLHRFMPVLAQNAGARVKEIPVQHHPRAAGLSNYGIGNRLFRGIRDLIMVRWYLRRQIPKLPIETFSRAGTACASETARSQPAF